MQYKLEIDSVQYRVSARFSLSDIFLQCNTGEIVGIFGRNGSGKSLLLKILFGTIQADNKYIRINNQILTCPYKKQGTIAYLPQHNFLPAQLTVKSIAQTFLFGSQLEALLYDDTFRHLQKTKIADLSGGELRYLEIQLVLNSAAKFVLLDEPLNHLSPIYKERVLQQIVVASAHKGIITTDHDYPNLSSIITHTYLMLEGSLKPIANQDELIFWKYLPDNRKNIFTK